MFKFLPRGRTRTLAALACTLLVATPPVISSVTGNDSDVGLTPRPSSAQTAQAAQAPLAIPQYNKSFYDPFFGYDLNGDGYPEVYDNFHIYITEGNTVRDMDLTSEFYPDNDYRYFKWEDVTVLYNNIVLARAYTYNYYTIFTFSKTDFKLLDIVKASKTIAKVDSDNDGIIEYIDYDTNRIYKVDPQGRFHDSPLMIYEPETSTAEKEDSDGRRYFVAWDYSMLGASMSQMFGRDKGGSSYALAGGDFISLDLNGDGLPDLINLNSGKNFLNIGNGKYYPQSFSGTTFFGDFNGDGLCDFLILENLALTCYITDSEGGEPSGKTILSGFSVKNIWSKDVDNDCDLDLVLIVTGSNSQCYGVIMENDGKGSFRRNEFAIPNCSYNLKDWDNDGNYELLFSENDVLKSFKIQGTKISGTAVEIPTDIDGTITDIPSEGKVLMYGYNGYSLLSDNSNSRPTAPAEAPSVVYEAKTGLVKISWAEGSDKETPRRDLTYSVRVGTAPGKDDVVTANASPDGQRYASGDGNVGSALQRIYDTSSWPSGTLYIAVQTVDANSQGSAFSQEAVFQKTALPNEFTMEHDDEFAINDTLTLRIHRLEGTSHWDLDDGIIVDSAADLCKVIFKTGGTKSISLQTEDAKGNLSGKRSKEITVLSSPLRCGEIAAESSGNESVLHPWAVFDLDEDGIDELYSGNYGYLNGTFAQGDSEGVYRTIPKMFNSHQYASKLTGCTAIATLDVNMDGMCDIVSGKYIGYNLGNLDMDFEMAPESFNQDRWIDFDNDGRYDAVTGTRFYPGQKYFRDNVTIWRNDGDYKSFKSNSLQLTGETGIFLDFNNDGLMDIAVKPKYQNQVILYKNNGDFTVTPENYITFPGTISILYDIDDYDLDGKLDIIYMEGYNKSDAVIWFGNGERFNLGYSEQVCVFDINNDGRKEIIAYKDGSWMQFTVYYITEQGIHSEPIDMAYDVYGGYIYGLGYGPTEALLLSDGTRCLRYWGYHSYSSAYRAIPAFLNVDNERPALPANLRHTQSDKFVIIEWDHSADKETPESSMRYNISIRHKGASGEGAYLFSPANSGKNGVRVPGEKPLPSCNRITIPIANIPAGDYEVMVQGVDLMHDQSDFSQVYEMHVNEASYVEAPPSGEVDVPVSIKILQNNETDIDWDGGKVLYTASGVYDVVWSTSGTKTIKVDGNPTNIVIQDAPDGSFTLPAVIRSGDRIEVKGKLMNQGQWLVIERKQIGSHPIDGPEYEEKEVSLTSDNKYALVEPVDSETAYITVKTYKQQIVHRVTSTFSTRNYEQTCNGPDPDDKTVSNPEIDFVTADPATGKYKVQWTPQKEVRAEATGINVYRETSVSDRYELVAELPLDAKEWVDLASTPDIMASRYVIAYKLTYGRSRYSTAHQPVHVMINRGAGSSWNLIWGNYEGGTIPQYRILRGDSPENLSTIATVSGHMTSYTDFSAPASGALYYAVEAVLSPETPAYASAKDAAASGAPRSNVVAAAGSNITLAESLRVLSTSGETTLQISEDNKNPSLQLMAVISPTTATFTRPSWCVISGEHLVTVDKTGRVTATDADNGVAIVRAMAIDGSGLFSDIEITVTGHSGIEYVVPEGETHEKLHVYPSPADANFCIEGLSGNETDVYIFSLGGKIAERFTTEQNSVNIDCDSWSPGVYVVKAVDLRTGENRTMKFIKR